MSSGLDWTDAETLKKADPYLAWADATRCASHRLPAEPGEHDWWLVLIELAMPANGRSPLGRLLDQTTHAWVQIPRVYKDLDARKKDFRYCTARVRRRFFQEVLSGGVLVDVVSRYKLCTPVEYPVQTLREEAEPPADLPAEALAGADGGPVIALIDGGLALGHSAFLKPDRTPRVAHYWRQDDHLGSRYLRDTARTGTPWPNAHGHWRASAAMGYGAELDRAAVAAAMSASQYLGLVDEDALYRRLGLWDLDRLAHHGTHVLSLAAGPYRYPEHSGTEAAPPDWGAASSVNVQRAEACDLVAVQLAWANVLDTSGRSVDAHILDALMYVQARCHDGAKVVVNLSWGGNAGPHDGSSILDRAMIDWCGLRSEPSSIAVSAGNSYQARGHANGVLQKDEVLELKWRILPECHTPSFLELWMDREVLGPGKLLVQVMAPGADSPIEITAPGVATWPAQPQPAATVVMLDRPNLGLGGSMVLVAVEPTAGDASGAWAPPGVWRVTVSNQGAERIEVCAYIERNDVAMGLFTGAKQSHFEDDRYNGGESIDDAVVQRPSAPFEQGNQSPVRRTGTLNHLATGADATNVHSVGGLVIYPTGRGPNELIPSPYSPRWDDANDHRVALRTKAPTAMMPSDDSMVLLGLRGAASRSGAVVRLVGTSSAVPLAVRKLVSGGVPPARPAGGVDR
jgi:hypothetical protein